MSELAGYPFLDSHNPLATISAPRAITLGEKIACGSFSRNLSSVHLNDMLWFFCNSCSHLSPDMRASMSMKCQ
jgi:hypothetical protein